jgi:hypothetical protein
MIKFTLNCENDHAFDAWFASGEAFDTLAGRGLTECVVCGSRKVTKGLMAPNVVTSEQKRSRTAAATMPDAPDAPDAPGNVPLAMDPERAGMIKRLQEMARAVRANADYVGSAFADEARKIHFGETDPRGIYGEASRDEVEALLEDGIDIAPLPPLPEDRN